MQAFHPPPLLAQTAEIQVDIGNMGWFAIVLWVIAALLMGWYLATQATAIRYATLADGQRARRALPLSFRMLLPFTGNLKVVRKPRYADARERIRRDLVTAGYDTVIEPADYLALRILIPLVLGPISIGFAAFVLSKLPGGVGELMQKRQGLLFIALLAYFALRPRIWLKRTIRGRHLQIERGLPFVLDLLTLSVEAGLDFMTAIRRLVERRKIDALSEEFIRAIREMQVGRTRRDALRDMAERAQQPDLSSVVSALVQADELGVGIGTILRIQAEQMRTRRFQRAEKMANEAPVKLLFPLVCFIFPSVFLVLLGPIFLQMLETGF